jgi:hypothetical protein
MLFRFITFVAVAFAWVFFRADNLGSAVAIIRGLAGFNGLITLQPGSAWLDTLRGFGVAIDARPLDVSEAFYYLLPCAVVAFLLPNSQEIVGRVRVTIEKIMPGSARATLWAPNVWWAAGTSTLMALAIFWGSGDQEFLYFKF